MLNLTYNYKLQPTSKQIEIIEHNLDVCRSVWNHALYVRKLWHNSRSCEINKCSLFHEYIVEPFNYPNYHVQSRELTLAKKDNDFLKSGNAQAMQQMLRKLDRAFNDMKSTARCAIVSKADSEAVASVQRRSRASPLRCRNYSD